MKKQCAGVRAWFRAFSSAVLMAGLAGASSQALGASLSLAAGRVSGPAAGQVVVPVLATNFTGISLLQFSLHWDTAAAGFVGVEQFGLPGMGAANFGTAQTAGGTLTVSWDDPNGLSTTLTNGAALFGVRLQLLGSPGSTSPVTLNGIPTPIEAADEGFSVIPVSVLNGSISVNAADVPPQITAQPQSATVLPGGTSTFSVTATGSGTLAYQWRFNGVGMSGQTEAVLTLANVQAAQAGGYSVVVANSFGSVTSTVATLTVLASNVPPVIAPVPTQSVNEGSLFSLVVAASDADQPAQALSYAIVGDAPIGLTLNPISGLVSWTPSEAQGPSTNLVTIRVTDNGSPALSDTRTLTIVVREVNSAPVVSPVANRTLNEGSLLLLTVAASDADLPANRLTYSLDPGAPAGAAINAQTGEFSWTPTEAQGPSVQTITVRVTDNGSPLLSEVTSFTITVNEVNAAPVLPAVANRTVAEGAVVAFDAVAVDSDLPVQALFYTLDPGAPAGAAINATTGAFHWTPSEAQGPSTNVITIRVTDNGSPMLSDFKSFVVVVTEVNTPPVLAAPGDQVLVEGSTLTLASQATDADLPAQMLTFKLGPGAPAGASVHPASGLLTWATGEANGPSTNQLVLMVTDSGQPALTATQVFQVVILESNQAPTLQPVPNQLARVLVPLMVTNVVTDLDIPTNQVSFQFLEAPKGARLNRLTGVIYWAPARDQARSTNLFRVIAMDNGDPSLRATNTFEVMVEDFVELMLGQAVLRSGESGGIPVTMLSSVGVTNVQSMLYQSPAGLSGLSLKGTAPEVGDAGLQVMGTAQSQLSIGARPGQSMAAYQQLGQLTFTAVSTQSAFVNLNLGGLSARQTNGLPVTHTLPGAGRVVVVASEPLLEATLLTNSQRQLVLYGPPGIGYRIEKTAELSPGVQWLNAWEGDLTNLQQVIPMTETNGMFYRARRLP